MARSSISKARLIAGVVAASCAFAGQDMRNPDDKKNPFAGQKPAIEAGQQRFKSNCAACHGADAEGGRGPALAGNRDLQRMTDQRLFNTIRQGIPGTSMPPSQMSDDQTWQIAAFVRNLSSPASLSVLPGNPANGRQLFFGTAECSQCHAIRGVGGLLGPDLTDAGANLTVHDLRESIVQPSARIAPGFDSVLVFLKNGEHLEGVAKDDTNYSISILDRKGTLHLLNKTEIAKIQFSNHSLMPDDIARRLGPEGLQDIVCFLASQTVRPPEAASEEQSRWRRIH